VAVTEVEPPATILDDWSVTASVGKAIEGVAVVLGHVVEEYGSVEVQLEFRPVEFCD